MTTTAATGTVAAIYTSPVAREPLAQVPRVRALADRGLEGDRYFDGVGSFSRWPGSGRAVSLIEGEAIDAILREQGIDLRGGRSRRNIVTRGIDLASLNGRRFRIGTAVLRGARLCAPCGYLQRLVGPGTFDAMRGVAGFVPTSSNPARSPPGTKSASCKVSQSNSPPPVVFCRSTFGRPSMSRKTSAVSIA